MIATVYSVTAGRRIRAQPGTSELSLGLVETTSDPESRQVPRVSKRGMGVRHTHRSHFTGFTTGSPFVGR